MSTLFFLTLIVILLAVLILTKGLFVVRMATVRTE
jgi:hypothetical protein